MTERDLERNAIRHLESKLTPPRNVWKISDTATGGQPDLEVAYGGHTSKIEFKLIKKGECIHDKWEDGRQLITLYRYEQATGRAWAILFRAANVAYDRGENETIIYRPSKLLNLKVPTAGSTRRTPLTDDDMKVLWHDGVLRLAGWNYEGIVDLIRLTHR
jgi:hypothetical protein